MSMLCQQQPSDDDPVVQQWVATAGKGMEKVGKGLVKKVRTKLRKLKGGGGRKPKKEKSDL